MPGPVISAKTGKNKGQVKLSQFNQQPRTTRSLQGRALPKPQQQQYEQQQQQQQPASGFIQI